MDRFKAIIEIEEYVFKESPPVIAAKITIFGQVKTWGFTQEMSKDGVKASVANALEMVKLIIKEQYEEKKVSKVAKTGGE